MEKSFKVILRNIRHKVMECFTLKISQYTMEIGGTTNKMVRELNNGRTKNITQEIGFKARKKASEN